MKFEVEFRRVSFVTYTIEAESPEQAEELAWQELPQDDADWAVQNIEAKE